MLLVYEIDSKSVGQIRLSWKQVEPEWNFAPWLKSAIVDDLTNRDIYQAAFGHLVPLEI
jgi:hypothetical protein